MIKVSHFYSVLLFSLSFCDFFMDESQEKEHKEIQRLTKDIPVLSKYATSLETHVKLRYLQKISAINVDPATIPSEQFDPECLPSIEHPDLFSYLVLHTSYYTSNQFKNYKSLEAYNQVVSGFVASVKGCVVSGKHVVVAKVRHSQRMNDPLVDVWLIAASDGTILSAHCLGCKAGLAESCSHVASALFYIECWARINGKLACTQVKCTWLLPTYVSEVSYERVKDIDFSSAKKLKENLDRSIDSFDGTTSQLSDQSETRATDATANVSEAEIDIVYKKLYQCKSNAVALSLIDPYADQFVSKSRNVPVISDLYEACNLDLDYPELLQKCASVKVDITDGDINIVEQDTRDQAKSSGFFRHRAGRIGASVSGAVYHSNLAQPSQSLIKSVCYPHLFKLNTKAIRHGRKYEEYAIQAYQKHMETQHINFQIQRCGLFINQEYPFLHATPDFLMSCDCCGLGCGEVKCPISIPNGDFEKYVQQKSSCLEKVNGNYQLKRAHNYHFQVQQQLFTLQERKHCDFIVYAIDSDGNAHMVCDRNCPDPQFSNIALQKLEAFWRNCILPEILGRWYTRKCDVPATSASTDNAICFCRHKHSDPVVACSNVECPYGTFHTACLSLNEVLMPKTWYCPHCSRLPQFKRGRGGKKDKQQTAVIQAAIQRDKICICNTTAVIGDKLLECHNPSCGNGLFFHLSCLGLKRMPNNAKTTWKCVSCKQKKTKATSAKPTTTSTSCSSPATSTELCLSSDVSDRASTSCSSAAASTASYLSSDVSDSDDDIEITKETKATLNNKRCSLTKLNNIDYDLISDPDGWLNCEIIQTAHVLLQELNPAIEGLQRTTLGPCRNFDVVTGEFIQILNTGSDHWVCVSSIGCLPGRVNLYDSLYHDAIIQEVEDQINDLLGGHLVGLDFVPVQQQKNGSDCGVFSIAFATCLAFANNPSHITFNISRMRPHLIACMRNGKMSMFPTI